MTNRTKTRWNRRAALGAGAAAVLGGGYLFARTSGGPVRHQVTPAGIFHRGNGAEPASLDPALIQSEPESNIVGDMMVGLMTYDAAAKSIPGMAASWTTSPDGLVWTFKLRDALWSDGEKVTAEDFVFSWRRILDPRTAGPYAYFLYVFKNAEKVNSGKLPLESLGARVLDPLILEVTLEHPAPYLLEMLTHGSLYPEPRHVVEAKGRAWAQPGNYVCNGAFHVTEWVPNEHVALVKNPHFYDAANVHLERIIYYPTDDYGAALQRFRAGELDIQNRIAPEEIEWIKAHLAETVTPIPQMTIEMVVVNHGRKPFDDIRVRTALSLVLNREAITEKIRGMGEVPAYNIVPPGAANFPGGNSLFFKSWSNERRLSEAQSLMQEAGFGPNNRLRTTYMIRSTAAGTYRAMAAAVQAMFSLIYVDIAILPTDFAIFENQTNIHDFDICQRGWQADFDDAETFLTLFLTGGGENWGQYSNPAFDALMAAEGKDITLEARGQKLVAAEAVLLKNQAVMPLFFWVNPDMVRPYVKGWVPNHMNYNFSRWVWIDQKARAALA